MVTFFVCGEFMGVVTFFGCGDVFDDTLGCGNVSGVLTLWVWLRYGFVKVLVVFT